MKINKVNKSRMIIQNSQQEAPIPGIPGIKNNIVIND
jgi:hypothetical protein